MALATALLVLTAQAASAVDLLGQVVALGERQIDPPHPLANTRVTVVGAGSAVTNAAGRFRVRLPYAAGAKVRIEMTDEAPGEDLVIYRPHGGWLRLPKPPDVGTPPDEVMIQLLPRGDNRLLDDYSIKQAFEQIAREAEDQLRPNGRPDEIDFTRYLERLGGRLGFTLADIERALADWRARKQADPNTDPHELGLVALSEKRFEDARRLFRRSRLANEQALTDDQQRLADLQAQIAGREHLIVRDLLAEAQAASLLPDPGSAKRLYARALERSAQVNDIDPWAQAVKGLSAAHRSLANISTGALSRTHIDAAVQTVEDALRTLSADAPPEIQANLRRQHALGLSAKAAYLAPEDGIALQLRALAELDIAEVIWDELGEIIEYSYVAVDQCDLLADLGRIGSGTEARMRLADAISACDAALWILSRDTAPFDWAWANNTMGSAIYAQGTRAAGAESLDLLQEAIIRHSEALAVYDKTTEPRAWATSKNYLGEALAAQGLRTTMEEGRHLLEQAVDAHRDALRVCSRETLPKQWALTKHDLGFALAELGARADNQETGVALLEQAIAVDRDALSVRTQDDMPREWAKTQSNLGHALYLLDARSEGEEYERLLRQAIDIYRSVLAVHTRETVPQDWARTQNNLGAALDYLGRGVRSDEADFLLDQAIDAYRKSLSVLTRESLPQDWARSLSNLGVALHQKGIRSNGQDSLNMFNEAVDAYDTALSVYTQDALPQDWARTQSNRGDTLLEAGVRAGMEDGNQAIEKATGAYRAAHSVFTREAAPRSWAGVQNRLSRALTELALRSDAEEAPPLLNEAVEGFRAALEVYTLISLPESQALVQNNLGHALTELAVRSTTEDRQRLFEEAVELYLAALRVRTQEAYPQDWALTQTNMGDALFLRGVRSKPEEGKQLIGRAIKTYRTVFNVYTPDELPQKWADTKRRLGAALASLGLRTHGEYGDCLLAEATTSYRDALIFHTPDEAPEQWVNTKNGLRDAVAFQALRSYKGLTILTMIIDGNPAQPADPDPYPELNPNAETSLRLFELAALTRLVGSGDAEAEARLATRRKELKEFLTEQPENFLAGHTYYGTMHYLSTDPTYAPYREVLLPLFRAANEGRNALLVLLAESELAGAEGEAVAEKDKPDLPLAFE